VGVFKGGDTILVYIYATGCKTNMLIISDAVSFLRGYPEDFVDSLARYFMEELHNCQCRYFISEITLYNLLKYGIQGRT
jgi:hypothetical protein